MTLWELENDVTVHKVTTQPHKQGVFPWVENNPGGVWHGDYLVAETTPSRKEREGESLHSEGSEGAFRDRFPL